MTGTLGELERSNERHFLMLFVLRRKTKANVFKMQRKRGKCNTGTEKKEVVLELV